MEDRGISPFAPLGYSPESVPFFFVATTYLFTTIFILASICLVDYHISCLPPLLLTVTIIPDSKGHIPSVLLFIK